MVDLNITVRPTRPGDVASLPAIERAAGERFREARISPGLPTVRLFPLSST
jgi:hypothetical protein